MMLGSKLFEIFGKSMQQWLYECRTEEIHAKRDINTSCDILIHASFMKCQMSCVIFFGIVNNRESPVLEIWMCW